MAEYFPTIKFVHMTCAWLSLAGFSVRGTAMLVDAQWFRRTLPRRLAMSVDTLLLATALTLAALSGQWPLQQNWLTAKLVALVLYIVLGMVALHWGRSRLHRGAALGAALLVFAYIISVATTRQAWPW